MLAQIFGPISGAHFNPAVTIGMLFKEGNANWMRNFTFTLMLLIAQGIGAVIGCAICLGGFKLEKSDNAKVMNKDYYIAQLCPANGCDDKSVAGKVFIVEMTCTFLFVNFVFMIAKHNGAADQPINALAVGLALFLAIREASGISGGCINPVVGLV
jgi:glycerol uptake facilitator protein